MLKPKYYSMKKLICQYTIIVKILFLIVIAINRKILNFCTGSGSSRKEPSLADANLNMWTWSGSALKWFKLIHNSANIILLLAYLKNHQKKENINEKCLNLYHYRYVGFELNFLIKSWNTKRKCLQLS